jgi:hypothetical protein
VGQAGKLAVAWPLLGGAVSGGAAVYDGGSIDLESPDGAIRTVNAREEWLLLAGMALPMPFGGTAGVNVKWINSVLLGEFGTHMAAIDAGAQYPLNDYCKAGIAVHDLGSTFSYRADPATLPTRVAAGLLTGWRLSDDEWFPIHADQVIGTADLERAMGTGRMAAMAGVEFGWMGTFSLRTGIRMAGDAGPALSGGLAFRHDAYRLEYGLQVLARATMLPQMFSLIIEW